MSNSSKSDSSKKSKIKKAYLIDVGYSIKDGKTYVSFFVKGKKTAKLYFQHDPYFYSEIPKAEFDKVKSSISVVRRDGSVGKIKAIEIASLIVGLEKKEFAKIICEQPSDVPQIKQQIPFPCFEYNIPFAKRFIYDFQLTPLDVIVYEREGQLIKKIIRTEHSPISLNAMAFDIETYNPQGIPNQEKDPIVMVSYSGKNSGVITYKPSKHDFVKTVSNEKEMLESFFEIVKNENPDVLVGYNSAQFDLPYIKTRVEKLKIPTNFSRYTSPLRFVNKGLIKGMKIEGRVHFDLFPVVKFFSFIGLIKTQSMSLDSVSEDVLGQKKVKVKKDEIWKEWDSGNIDHLAHYSLVDSDLTKKLNDKFIPIQMELSSVAKLPLFETSISTSGQLVENLLMFHASNRHELIPQKPGGDAINSRLEAPIQGAFVKLPEPGIYENIAVLDFRGLYPSIIISYNIDPYTLVTDKNSNDAKDCFQSPTDAFFSKSKQGLVPFVLDYLVEKRGKIKDEIKTVDKSSDAYVRLSARSHALKILANSFYGYLGYARSRWYSRPCAESVTAWGRKHISETIAFAEKSGFNVLYADTDSVFLLYKNKDDVIKFMNDINSSLPDKMELELEGFYTRGVFVSKRAQSSDGEDTGAKKKYALLGDDGRTKIRGFELVRRDWSSVAKDTQKAVLEAILKEGSKEKAAKIIRDVLIDLRSGKIPLDRLAISTQITKPLDQYDIVSPETAAAKKLAASGQVVEKGSIIAYVIGKSGKTISEKAIPLEMAKDYDYEYYQDNQILPAVMKIMKELGYDEYSLKVGGKQQSLDSFF